MSTIAHHHLTVVCTDRGQHPRRTLARLSVGEKDGRVFILRMGRTRRHTDDGRFIVPPDPKPSSEVTRRPDGGVTFTFTCPTCRRNVPLRDDRLMSLTEVRAGQPWWIVSDLDISHRRT